MTGTHRVPAVVALGIGALTALGAPGWGAAASTARRSGCEPRALSEQAIDVLVSLVLERLQATGAAEQLQRPAGSQEYGRFGQSVPLICAVVPVRARPAGQGSTPSHVARRQLSRLETLTCAGGFSLPERTCPGV